MVHELAEPIAEWLLFASRLGVVHDGEAFEDLLGPHVGSKMCSGESAKEFS